MLIMSVSVNRLLAISSLGKYQHNLGNELPLMPRGGGNVNSDSIKISGLTIDEKCKLLNRNIKYNEIVMYKRWVWTLLFKKSKSE